MTIDELYFLLIKDKPSSEIKSHEKELFKLIPELSLCKGFNQHNDWHPYDVYEHTLKVIDGVPNNIVLRLAALFHDIGKPSTFIEDAQGVGHFPYHWGVSQKVFERFAQANNLDANITSRVSKLIQFHDSYINKLTDDDIKSFYYDFDYNDIKMLFELKKADLLAQNEKYHYLLDDYQKQKERLLSLLKIDKPNSTHNKNASLVTLSYEDDRLELYHKLEDSVQYLISSNNKNGLSNSLVNVLRVLRLISELEKEDFNELVSLSSKSNDPKKLK